MNLCFAGLFLAVTISAFATSPKPWWDKDVEASISRAPSKKVGWVRLLRSTKPPYRTDVAYLLKYMTVEDLARVTPAALTENVRLAEAARAKTPWGKSIPNDVFLDAVLPYANVTEPRDSMRAVFMERYLSLAAACRTPGEAALALNRTIFKDYKVGYNTKRLRTDQSPRETISQGMATCTGLSIMLADACRAVGVPARLAGIHSWPGRGGNHTWVEIWDGGWHFVGAAEPDEHGLDHAWFVDDAAKAIKGAPENAIFAVAYRKTGDYWPIAWAPEARVNGENVTDRYAKKSVAPPRLMVEVVGTNGRVASDVTALDVSTGRKLLSGKSFGPQADVNFHLSSPVPAGSRCMVVARTGSQSSLGWVTVDKDTVIRLVLGKHDEDGVRSVVRAWIRGEEPASKLLAAIPSESWSLAIAAEISGRSPTGGANLLEALSKR